MPTLLDYALITEPFPLLASTDKSSRPAKLTIIASNRNPQKPVTIKKKISISLPIGAAARDLTATPPVNTVAPPHWAAPKEPRKGEGVAIYDFIPDAGYKEVGEEGLRFIFNDVNVNMQPGTCFIEILEVISTTEDHDTTLSVAKFPHTWGDVKFVVNPANIKAGKDTTLEWDGPAEATYAIEYSMPAIPEPIWIRKLANKGKYPGTTEPPLTLEVTTNFTLHVLWDLDERHYHAQQQRTVTVIPRPLSIDYFRPRNCTTSDCVILDDEFILEWQFQNVDQWQLSQEWPDFPERPARVIQAPWESRFTVVRPTEKKTRYTLMVKDKSSNQLTATVNATLAPPVPVGTIVPYGALLANNLPSGWLYCNGSEYTKAHYPQLFPIIGEVYGRAGSTSNGKLPDLRGYFVRGYDDGVDRDPGRKLGSVQDDALRSHSHGQKVTANPNTGTCTRSDFNGDAKTYSEYEQGVSTYATGDRETRPKNVATYFVIYGGVYVPPSRAKQKEKKSNKARATGRRAGR